jgi:uncharacterized membrane protein
MDNRFNRGLSLILTIGSLFYLVAGGTLLIIFGPIKMDILGIGFSHTSLTKPAQLCLLIFLIGIFFELRYRGRRGGSGKNPPVIRWLSLLALIWGVAFSLYAVLLHYTYRSGALDMAVHSQLIWNLSQGYFLQSSFTGYSFAANHYWVGLYLFVPVFLAGGEYALLISQAFIIALGVFPAYYLARDIVKSHRWSLVFAIAYLLYPTLSVGILYEFHLEPITVPIIITALLYLRRRRFILFAALALLSVSLYEVTAMIFALLGLILLFRARYRLVGLILFITMSIYLILIFKVIMPHFGRANYFPHWDRYSHLGANLRDASHQVLLHPLDSIKLSINEDDINNLIYVFQGVGFLPFLAPFYLIPALPLILTLLLSNWSSQMDIRLGYLAPAIPFLFLSAIYGVRRIFSFPFGIGRWFRRYGILLLLLISGSLFINFQLERQTRGFPFPFRANLDEIYSAAALIPPDAYLSADWHLGSHFGGREIILLFPVIKYKKRRAEYIFLDLAERTGKDETYWNKVDKLLRSEGWAVIYFSRGVLLLKRGGAGNPALTSAGRKYLQKILENTHLP